MNDNFHVYTTTNVKEINSIKLIEPEKILEIFAFKEEDTIISYDLIELIDGKDIRSIKLFDFFLRNLFVDLKKFSNNKFETNSGDISFTRINI